MVSGSGGVLLADPCDGRSLAVIIRMSILRPGLESIWVADAKALHVNMDGAHRHPEGALHSILNSVRHAARDRRDAQTVLEDDVDVENQTIRIDRDLHPLPRVTGEWADPRVNHAVGSHADHAVGGLCRMARECRNGAARNADRSQGGEFGCSHP